MSKYDNLDARTQLEQVIHTDLSDALTKRGFTVTHRGTPERHAAGGRPDIEAAHRDYVLAVEPTKSKGAAQDREFNAIRDHLVATREANAQKRCFGIFVSPETSTRMLDSIRMHNQQKQQENRTDLLILPMSFETLELWTTKLRESTAAHYPVNQFIGIFLRHAEFVDDVRIRKLLVQELFPTDRALTDAVERAETERDQQNLAELISDLSRLENRMREASIVRGPEAIDTLIYLVFLKLFEEKREAVGHANRLRSREAFEQYRDDGVDARVKVKQLAIHSLFRAVKQEPEFLSSGMFSTRDKLPDSLRDDFVLADVIPTLQKYHFAGTRLDALGAVYEVLAQRAEKDVKVGQFFTPQNIVRFMVQLAELDHRDRVLDPACGTGRFLIYAMNDMLTKVRLNAPGNRTAEARKVKHERLFGSDIDPRIAKLAKMNMWVHGDGKTNILGGRDNNGLTLYQQRDERGRARFANRFDVVLTNPPLGDVNYQVLSFDSGEGDEYERAAEALQVMPVLPRKDLILEQRRAGEKKLNATREQLTRLEADAAVGQAGDYARLLAKTRQAVARQEAKVAEVQRTYEVGERKFEISGNKMKGGALFLNAIWHYLKDTARPDDLPEWQGGRVLIVLDEGILNTDNYAATREFIREHYYVKAVISLTRDAFVPISHTTTKTSILYAIKKTDRQAVQREPVFFAHVEKVGLDTKGKAAPNHLDAILQQYAAFKQAILQSYNELEFSADRFRQAGFAAGEL